MKAEKPAWRFGVREKLSGSVRIYLFGIGANNSGTTFLKNAISTSRSSWNLPLEGQFTRGFAGPNTRERGSLLWTHDDLGGAALRDPAAYDWPRTRRAWHLQAFARSAGASVFYTKAPPFLFHVESLRAHFQPARFIFTIRNPYAVCEGISRRRSILSLPPSKRCFFEAAAEHVVCCMAQQRRNVEAHVPRRGVFFSYETMCAEPERAEALIRSQAPELDDLNLRQRLSVKQGIYYEMLTDMNQRQIAALSPVDFDVINAVFCNSRAVLDYFEYDLMRRPSDLPESSAA